MPCPRIVELRDGGELSGRHFESGLEAIASADGDIDQRGQLLVDAQGVSVSRSALGDSAFIAAATWAKKPANPAGKEMRKISERMSS